MGKTYDLLTPELRDFISQQHLFFVATAPQSGGHINVSPKGLDSLRILDDHTVAYLDITGSGIETVAHIRENGRITLMFCSFDSRPMILRLYGQGEFIHQDSTSYSQLKPHFPDIAGARGIIRVAVTRIADSCGYGVPLMEFARDRDTLEKASIAKGEDKLSAYRQQKNMLSIDGLPGLEKS